MSGSLSLQNWASLGDHAFLGSIDEAYVLRCAAIVTEQTLHLFDHQHAVSSRTCILDVVLSRPAFPVTKVIRV